MYLLINLADRDSAFAGDSERDMIALPCRDLDELAHQIALKDYARSLMRQRPQN
jgi:hypothetical protein